MNLNTHFLDLKPSYLFTEIVNRTRAFQETHPDAQILRMGVGDVRGPMTPSVITALHQAVDNQATAEAFHGYGLECGETWFRERIAQFEYRDRGIRMTADEVFVSDGAGSDLGNLSDIFSPDNRVAIFDPVYPSYFDTNVMAGRPISLLPATPDNGFAPLPKPDDQFDIIYLCSPGNPTGEALNRSQLQAWVDYANEHGSVIIFDGAYEAFVRKADIPRSVYECEGARSCAIEIRSFSKIAGFTGVRCGYTIVPSELVRNDISLASLWLRRQCTKFNGASILSQKAAMAVLTEIGHSEVMERVEEYRSNALLLKEALCSLGHEVYGAENSPYVWFRVPEGYTSWSYFEHVLNRYHIVSTPGVGFGPSGEGFIRLTGFSTTANTHRAIERLLS